MDNFPFATVQLYFNMKRLSINFLHRLLSKFYDYFEFKKIGKEIF